MSLKKKKNHRRFDHCSLAIHPVMLTGILSGIYTAIFSTAKLQWCLITGNTMQVVNHNKQGPLSRFKWAQISQQPRRWENNIQAGCSYLKQVSQQPSPSQAKNSALPNNSRAKPLPEQFICWLNTAIFVTSPRFPACKNRRCVWASRRFLQYSLKTWSNKK